LAKLEHPHSPHPSYYDAGQVAGFTRVGYRPRPAVQSAQPILPPTLPPAPSSLPCYGPVPTDRLVVRQLKRRKKRSKNLITIARIIEKKKRQEKRKRKVAIKKKKINPITPLFTSEKNPTKGSYSSALVTSQNPIYGTHRGSSRLMQ